MFLKEWNDLPESMKVENVRKYYDALYKVRYKLFVKRIFDIVSALFIAIIFLPLISVISVAIKIDSAGPVFFRQTRVTQYGKHFRIYKFRTMVNDAEKIGTQVTIHNDYRVTKIGKILRKFRLDEIPQVFNIIIGDMSFVGTRPEVPRYVERYTDLMMATLFLPAGLTSEASIKYKDEEKILENVESADNTYIELILPKKMELNLKGIEEFSLLNEFTLLVQTAFAVFNRGKSSDNNNYNNRLKGI
ncbi:Putative undecaprenyl-phosphate N-acetylgalactosaminyl 1-phosphate transferase [Paenibacillus konkukensis]|uniref:Undecaprenyl-phosphate N-acetylgalactosaminyl 1-phosphate transferase n=1 Tax=Paenibacillus konkukensis TaxID=2020716 RepID=A0ABY4RQU9_9BACL|nr:sugar transferase [Paenibacillus konkukensis]UQZ84340.1 Putative undecaprenyl-phosphate N-acetylgalactosaminyl 1-phosphate transferase [Paenibacillus konkukensis]